MTLTEDVFNDSSQLTIDLDLYTKFIFNLLPEKPPYRLSMDRTNWKFDKTKINTLMIRVCYKGVGIPLI